MCGSSSTTRMRSGSRPCLGAGRPGAAPDAGPGAGPGAPAPTSPATGSVKVKRAPRPTPPLSARMRPPWASTSPLQIARPRPAPPVPAPRPPSAAPEYLRNSCARRSGAMPLPSSATETATCTPSRSAATRIGEDSGACRAAFASRLFSTCSTRWRSAMTRGRSGGRSIVTVWRAPAGEEGGARPVDQRRHLRGLGRDRERAGVDAPGVEQVGDQADHAVGLVVDDADELAGLGRRELTRGAEQRAGRALDGGQRHA